MVNFSLSQYISLCQTQNIHTPWLTVAHNNQILAHEALRLFLLEINGNSRCI